MKRPSPSIVISFLALVVALGGAGLAANGGPIILGQLNIATLPTQLSASLPNQAFHIQNLSTGNGATALRLVVADGKPPMTVSSDTLVGNLNADLLDGRHGHQMIRVGRGFDLNSTPVQPFVDKASITMAIPARGFVLVNAVAYANTTSSSCNPCTLLMRVRDKTSNDVSTDIATSVGNGTAVAHNDAAAVTWVFPVTVGARTFSLETAKFPSDAAIDTRNPVITALYLPFGPTGGQTLTGGSPQ